MADTARNHHYISQFYLRGFRRPEGNVGKRASIWVFDIDDGKVFRTSIRNVASQRDFNRIEGENPNALESALSNLEGEFSAVVKRIQHDMCMPVGDDLNTLFNMIAMFSVHHPQSRQAFTKFHEQVADGFLQMITSDEQRWSDAISSFLPPEYQEIAASASYAGARALVEQKTHKIEISNEYNLRMELEEGMNAVLPTLAGRKWTLFVAHRDDGHLVSCDNPVYLGWKPGIDSTHLMPPGHGMPESEVIFPLSPRMAMYGTFEDEGAVVRATKRTIAQVNDCMASVAMRQVYSPRRTILLPMEDGIMEMDTLPKHSNSGA